MAELLDQAGASNCQIVCLPEGWATYNTGLGMSKIESNTLDGSPDWNWIGNPGRGEWSGVWRKDRRPDTYENLSDFESTDKKLLSK
jgi:hypothetical protein